MSLAHFQKTFTDDTGNIKAGLSVEVRRESDGALAPLYADKSRNQSKSNPFITDSQGYGDFYAASGRYRIQATGIDWRNFDLVGFPGTENRVGHLSSVTESFAGRPGTAGEQLVPSGWREGSEIGGGQTFVYDPTAPKAGHNGGTIISGTVPGVSAQSGATTAEKEDNFRAGNGETEPTGTGCYVMLDQTNADSQWWGLDEVVIYVATTGADTASGFSSQKPLLNIQEAANRVMTYGPNRRGGWKIKVAAGTYANGAVIERTGIDNELLIEGEVSGTTPLSILDSAGAEASGINCNDGVRARVRYMDVKNFSSNLIAFQNGSFGIIDTCKGSGGTTFGWNASEFSDMTLVGTCRLDVPTGGRGLRWYRQSTGSLGDGTNQITVAGGGAVSDGIQVRDNSYVVANNGLLVDGFQNVGIDVFKHSYLELRDHTVSNCAIARRRKSDGIIAFDGTSAGSGNTLVDVFGAFSYDYFTDGDVSTIHGNEGRTTLAADSNYDLLFRNNGASGIQALLNGNIFNIDANKSERISLVNANNTVRIWTGGVERYRFGNTSIIPVTDNANSLGNASFRFSEVFAGSGTINTSDERLKTELLDYDEAERQTAIALKGLIRKFRYRDAVSQKGDGARIHFGVGAQAVGECFRQHGLEPENYGVFCYDAWDESEDEATGEVTPAGDRYGIRYDELLAFIIGAL